MKIFSLCLAIFSFTLIAQTPLNNPKEKDTRKDIENNKINNDFILLENYPVDIQRQEEETYDPVDFKVIRSVDEDIRAGVNDNEAF